MATRNGDRGVPTRTSHPSLSALRLVRPLTHQGPLGDGFDPLCDQKMFGRVFLEHGALTWPGGIDLAPDAMYERIRSSGKSVLAARSKRVA